MRYFLIGLIALFATQACGEMEKAIVAGGCFWCVEADFEQVAGVRDVVSGYTGGHVDHPTYEQVSAGDTGHYEAVEITFDNQVISYPMLIEKFLRTIDVTDAGGQFCDRGDSYRTAIFVKTPAQKMAAEAAIEVAEADLGRKIVTPILAAAPFWPAEAYHQDYYTSTELVFTRRGPKEKRSAYKFYRMACGRDARLQEVWGKQAGVN